MKALFGLYFILFTTLLFGQDEFVGQYSRHLDQNKFELIVISETENCYSGKFGESMFSVLNLREVNLECYLDEDDYFFLVISWDDLEFELSPLEWDQNGQISTFELLAEFELDEPLIFNRIYN